MNWNAYFLHIAFEVAKKSKDPSSKVGCVIATKDNRPISFGYNGFPQGCDERIMTWDRPLKYHMVVHAEMNAMMFAERSLRDTKMYTTMCPCENCLKHALQAGVAEIYFKQTNVIDRMSLDSKEALVRLLRSQKKTHVFYIGDDGKIIERYENMLQLMPDLSKKSDPA